MSVNNGKIVTWQTKELYMKLRKIHTQEVAAPRVGISKRTGYKIEKGMHI